MLKVNFTKILKKDRIFPMTKSHAILGTPLLISILGIIFCVWSAFGNDVNFCVTTGCTLYQDFTLFGISLWWYGTAAFTILAACAVLGFAKFGQRLGALFLTGDICLLILMSLTAPCVSCLAAAVMFALSYVFFRRSAFLFSRQNVPIVMKNSIILMIWLIFFIVNIGQVARSQINLWPILDESGQAHMRMFFSPSCRYCVEGINVLSGNVDVAFYPVAENDEDVYRIGRMAALIEEGMGLSEALAQSADAAKPNFFESLSLKNLLLRFRLISNKAHVFSSGSQGVPFFENLGLPPSVRTKIDNREKKSIFSDGYDDNNKKDLSTSDVPGPKDPNLPVELEGQCGGSRPCIN